jgi:hypothetical protein
MRRYAGFDEYLAGQSAKNRSILRALRAFVKRTAPKLEETVKWGNGCWVKGKRPVAYLYSAKGCVQFGFFRGSSLKDPKGLLEGAGNYVRHIKLYKISDLDRKAFGALLKQAIR